MNGLVVVDITDPGNPSEFSAYNTIGAAYGVCLSSDGTEAYIADLNNGLVVIDLTLFE